jgi:hypothetical protein
MRRPEKATESDNKRHYSSVHRETAKCYRVVARLEPAKRIACILLEKRLTRIMGVCGLGLKYF